MGGAEETRLGEKDVVRRKGERRGRGEVHAREGQEKQEDGWREGVWNRDGREVAD